MEDHIWVEILSPDFFEDDTDVEDYDSEDPDDSLFEDLDSFSEDPDEDYYSEEEEEDLDWYYNQNNQDDLHDQHTVVDENHNEDLREVILLDSDSDDDSPIEFTDDESILEGVGLEHSTVEFTDDESSEEEDEEPREFNSEDERLIEQMQGLEILVEPFPYVMEIIQEVDALVVWNNNY